MPYLTSKAYPLFHRFAATIVFLFVFTLASLWAGAFKSSPGGEPKISWTPTSLNTNVAAGKTNVIGLSFVASADLSNVALRVVPELQPFVQITPSLFASIKAGEPIPVTIAVSASAITLPQTVSGVIQLRNVEGNNRTIPNPLPVTLGIEWRKFSDTNTGTRLMYPDFGVTSKVESVRTSSGATRLDVSFQSPGDTNFANGFGVFLYQNFGNASLADWFHQRIDLNGTLLSSGAFTETTLANGMNAFVISGPLPDDFGPVLSAYTISKSGNTVIAIGQAEDNQLGTLGLTQNQIDQLMLQILVNLQAP